MYADAKLRARKSEERTRESPLYLTGGLMGGKEGSCGSGPGGHNRGGREREGPVANGWHVGGVGSLRAASAASENCLPHAFAMNDSQLTLHCLTWLNSGASHVRDAR